MEKRMRLFKNEKGLTLIELLAVIVVLGIVAAIAVPSIGGVIEKSKKNADKASLLLIQEAAMTYMVSEDPATNPDKASIQTVLVNGGYLNKMPKIQTVSTFTFSTFSVSGNNGAYTVEVFDAADVKIDENRIDNL